MAALSRRRWVVVLAVAAVVTVVLGALGLRVRPHTSLVDLLPDGSAAAADYRTFLETFGGTERVFVLVEGPAGATPDELASAAETVAAGLRTSRHLRDVRAGIEPSDLAFFERWVLPRRILLTPIDSDRIAAALSPDAIRRRVADLRTRILAPTSSFERPLLRADPLGIAADGSETIPIGGLPVDPASGTFQVERPPTALVIATAAAGEIDVDAGRQLLDDVSAAEGSVVARLGPGWSVAAVGGPLYAAHDEELIRSDLARTVSGSLLGCVLVLVIAFGGWRIPAIAAATVATGLVWTAGLVGLAGGAVSAVSLGFAAVLVGLGVDYAIHAGARFRDETLAGHAPRPAAGRVARVAGVGIAASAATTATASAVLTAAHFRPLREVGALVAAGIVAMLVATAVVGLGGLAVAGPRGTRTGAVWRLLGRIVGAAADVAGRRPRTVLAAAALLTTAALPGLLRLRLDADPRAIRPSDHPTTATEVALAERFGVGSDTVTVVVPGGDVDEALRSAAAVARIARDDLPPGTSIVSPSDWLVDERTARARVAHLRSLPLEDALATLERELRSAGLDPAGFAPGLDALRAITAGAPPRAPPASARPAWLDALIRPRGDQVHAAIRIRLAPGVWPAGPPPETVERIRDAAPGAAIASALRLAGELRRLAAGDLRVLGLLAVVAVGTVVAASFRFRLAPSAVAVCPVALGTTWALGLWGMTGHVLDLVGLAVLPVLLGIGIDDGLHAVHGAHPDDPDAGVRLAGIAMTLTTLTTCVGFGSLALSHMPGLRHAAVLVPLGVVACLAATLLVVPALLRLVPSAVRR